MSQIHVQIGPPSSAIAGHWASLIERAAPNVFMHPAVLTAAANAFRHKLHVLTAWRPIAGEPDRLVGLWALQERRVATMLPPVLTAPPFDYAFVSNPVIDRSEIDSVTAAFLDAIAAERALPNVLRLRYLDGGDDTGPALERALSARQAQVLKLSDRERPFAWKDRGVKRSGSTRKKLRQDFNRLSAQGGAEVANNRDPGAVLADFETYLALEAASWKGAEGTALLSHDADAAFARTMIAALASVRSASVALLRVAGRPVAAQVLLYCGTTAYTWKTAFDAEFAKFSPGALLVDKAAEELFVSGTIEAIEACSPEGGFMSQMWDGRRSTIGLLADLGARESLNFILTAFGERSYQHLRGWRDRLRAAGRTVRNRNTATGR